MIRGLTKPEADFNNESLRQLTCILFKTCENEHFRIT